MKSWLSFNILYTVFYLYCLANEWVICSTHKNIGQTNCRSSVQVVGTSFTSCWCLWLRLTIKKEGDHSCSQFAWEIHLPLFVVGQIINVNWQSICDCSWPIYYQVSTQEESHRRRGPSARLRNWRNSMNYINLTVRNIGKIIRCFRTEIIPTDR